MHHVRTTPHKNGGIAYILPPIRVSGWSLFLVPYNSSHEVVMEMRVEAKR